MVGSACGARSQNCSWLNLERASATPLLTPSICHKWRSKFFCMPSMASEWTRTIMDLLLEEHLAMICRTDVLSQCTRILLPLNWSPRWPEPWYQHTAPSSWCWWAHPRSRCLETCPDANVLENSSQNLHHWHQWRIGIWHWWASGTHTTGWPHSM